MKKRKFGSLLAVVFTIFVMSACAGNAVPETSGDSGAENEMDICETDIVPSDYENEDNWLAHPKEKNKLVDTIYLYPTAFIDQSEGAKTICDIDDSSMRALAQGYYQAQASVYEESTNVFIPYYRQVNLAAVYGMPTEERNALSAGIPQTDVFAALDHYFEEDNDGRPFILAGHSQGSQMLTNVLKQYMSAHPEYLGRMIAAYVIGYSVTDDYLLENPHLKFAEGETDTGVIISWNTEGEGNKEQDSFVILPGAQCINPLNWKRDETYAGAGLNIGGRVPDSENGGFIDIPEAADAVIDTERGVIITTTTAIEPVQAAGFGTDSFHNGDYSLYYYNLRENVAKRCAAYFLNEIAYESPALVGKPSDYSNENNWIQIPEIQHDIDTIYIYPTVYINFEEGASEIADIDDELMRTAAQVNFSENEGAFSESTNVFAPYYRQSNISGLIDKANTEFEAYQSGVQRTDIFAALDYYFENYNEGRPFILSGHSQGSIMLRIVLKDYMRAHPEYYERMVAAYVLGFSITQEDLDKNPHLRFAEREDDTGIIISWNIEGKGNRDQYNAVVLPGAISINPINWKRDDTYASAEENLGTYLNNRELGVYEEVDTKADAQVDTERGVVICTTSELPFVSESNNLFDIATFFGSESYHNGDYAFYYDNIKQNVRARCEAYMISH